MSIKSAAIEFRPRPSVLLIWVLLGFHILAALVVLLSVAYKLAAAALLLITFWSWYRAHRLHCQHRGPKAIRRLQWQSDGHWLLENRQQQNLPATLLPSSYLHPRLLILNFKLQDGGRRNVLLLPDSLDAQTLRRLRSRLRIEAASSIAASLKQA